MGIERFDEGCALELEKAIVAALDPVAQRFGATIKAQGLRWSAADADVWLSISLMCADQITFQQEREAFTEKGHVYGFTKDDLGREFADDRGNRFRIVGLNPQAPAYPVIVRDLRYGRALRLSADWVKKRLRVAPVAAVEVFDPARGREAGTMLEAR